MSEHSVLIVEDDDNLRRLLEASLRTSGYNILTAENGKIGLELFRQHAPTVMILDLRMPEMNGFELLETLRPKLDDPYAVIVITGYDQNEDIEKSYSLGASNYINKPFSVTHVRESVKCYVKLKDLERKRKSMEDYIRKMNEDLERKVSERTRELQREISDHKSAREKIRESESNLKAIFNNTVEAFLLVDSDLNVKMFNKTAIDRMISLYGKGIKEGESILDFIEDDQRAQFKAHLERSLTGKNITFEKEFGDNRSSSVWFEYRISPVYDERHVCDSVFVIIADITGRKEAELELRRINERLEQEVEDRTKHLREEIAERKRQEQELRRIHAAVEGASEAVVITAQSGEASYINQAFARLFGYDLPSLGHLDLSAICSDESLGKMIFRSGTSGDFQATNHETKFRAKDTREIPVQVKSSVIKGEGDEPVGILHIITDLTEQKEAEAKRAAMEAQLRQAQKLESIGQLASGIAHEINTPTQFVGDNTQFLKDSFEDILKMLGKFRELLEKSGDGPVAAEFLEETKELVEETDMEFLAEEIPEAIEQSLGGIKRISEIVKAMKDFSHPATEQKKMLNINKAIGSTIIVSRNEWKYHCDVETEFTEDLPLVPCYPGEFNQIILNLIVNAAHAIEEVQKQKESTAEKGRITIATKVVDQWVAIDVTDTGTGISDDVKAKIFDPFFTTKEIGKGTGQGMAIVYNIVTKRHGGELSFETKVGAGTTFTVKLPLKASEK